MKSEDYEKAMSESFEHLYASDFEARMVVGVYRQFLHVIHMQMLNAPKAITEYERGKLYDKLSILFTMGEAKARDRNAQGKLRDVLLKEWAQSHYEAARLHFRDHMGETEEEFIGKEDGPSTEEYFHHLIGKAGLR